MQKTSEFINGRLHLFEFLSVFFALSCSILLITLLVLTNVFSFSFTSTLASFSKKGNGFGKIYEYNQHSFQGEIRITPHDYSDTLIQGEVKGLSPGHSYSILILENSNFLLDDFRNEKFYHLNPTKSESHSCKSVLSENKGHKGDLGNIIAASNGVASIEVIIKNLNYMELLGRSFVILNHEDKCENHSPFILKDEIMMYSVIALYSDNSDLEDFEKNLQRKKELEENISRKQEAKSHKKANIEEPQTHKIAEVKEITTPKFEPSNARNLEPVPQSQESQVYQEPVIRKEQGTPHKDESNSKSEHSFDTFKSSEYIPSQDNDDKKVSTHTNVPTHTVSSNINESLPPPKKEENLKKEKNENASHSQESNEPVDHENEHSFFESPLFNPKPSLRSNNNMQRSHGGPNPKHEEDDAAQAFMDSLFGPLLSQTDSGEGKKSHSSKPGDVPTSHESNGPKLFHGFEPNSPISSGIEGLEGIRDENTNLMDNFSNDEQEDHMTTPVILKKNGKKNGMNFKELLFNPIKQNEIKKNLTSIITTNFDLPIGKTSIENSTQLQETHKDLELKKLSKNFEENVKTDLKNHLKSLEPKAEKIPLQIKLPIDPILLLEHRKRRF